MNLYDVIIIGAGCAGLSASIYCGRAGLKTLVLADEIKDKGGMLAKTSMVENYPGFPDGIMGYNLIENFEKQALLYDVKIESERVEKIVKSNGIGYFTIDGIYTSKTVIIATGSRPNKLYLPNEEKLWGNGISSCAVCDGACYKNKIIVVVGGGDSALEEALFLTRFSNVILIHRKDSFNRASKIMISRVLKNEKIKIVYDTIITELKGENKLESILCKNLKTEELIEMKVNGLFYGLGLIPNSDIVKGLVSLDDNGYIERVIRGRDTETSLPGLFVAGDVSDKIYRQAIVASGDGCKSALDVIHYLEEHN